MSGVLARLAQRALGATNLRPRLGGAFEPAPAEEIMAGEPTARPPAPPRLAAPVALAKQAGAEEDLLASAAPEQPSAAPGPPPSRPRPASPHRPPPTALPGRDTMPVPPVAAAGDAPFALAPPPASAAPSLHQPLLPPAPPALLRPEPVPARRPAPEAQPPDITISIGSIEFRAPPQPRPAPAAPPPAPRLMSLEDYLAKGHRGRR
jgi:hypothetical protein